MEIVKKIKASKKEVDILFELSGNISVQYYQREDHESFLLKLRIPEELAPQVKKAKSFKKLMELNARNCEWFCDAVDRKIASLKEEIKNLERLKNTK